MIDRNKVVKGLECCQYKARYCNECPYKGTSTVDMLCLSMVVRDALYLLEQQETLQPVRESTSDFVRFNQGEVVAIINRNHIIDAAYNPSTDETRVCMRGINALVKYKGNIVDKITGDD